MLLQFDDQGIVNTDARTIAVPDSYVNIIPTDVRGITFSRTPQMNINILTLGNPDGVGVFFPNGLIGAISKPTGYNMTASGTDDFPSSPMVAFQVRHSSIHSSCSSWLCTAEAFPWLESAPCPVVLWYCVILQV